MENTLVSKAFAQNGGQYIDASGEEVVATIPAGKTAGVFVPDTDGTFGELRDCNILGLSGSDFIAGIPKYFIASEVKFASGTGTLYFS